MRLVAENELRELELAHATGAIAEPNAEGDGFGDVTRPAMEQHVVARTECLQETNARLEREVERVLRSESTPRVVNLSYYLQRLSEGFAQISSASSEQLIMRVDLEVDVAWELEIVVPLGLIVSEVLTNSFKYAFPDGRSVRIRVMKHVQRDGMMQLQVEHDGVGMPIERRSGSLRRELIERFAQQLKGEATFGNRSDGNGTMVTVTFPNPSPSALGSAIACVPLQAVTTSNPASASSLSSHS